MFRLQKLILLPICLLLVGCTTVNVSPGASESPKTQTPEELRVAEAQFECQELNSVIKDFYQVINEDQVQALEFATPFQGRDNATAAKIAAWFKLAVVGAIGLEDDATTEEFDNGISASLMSYDFWDELSITCFDAGIELIGGTE